MRKRGPSTVPQLARRWGVTPRVALGYLQSFAVAGLAVEHPDGRWSATLSALRDVGADFAAEELHT